MIKKVFIIGAGSNVDLGFPTGAGLRNLILRNDCDYKENWDTKLLKKFIIDFRLSRIGSIDRYIEKNGQFAEIGKFLIAYYISRMEKQVIPRLDQDIWYSELFNKVLEEYQDVEEQILFVSFNYDRSLEHFIKTAIDRTFILPTNFSTTQEVDDFISKKKKLEERFAFEYVYGKIGDLKSNPYGNDLDYESLVNVSEQIKLITDERKDEKEHIRKHILSANLIYIIGFGFDKTNMKYIGLNSPGIAAKAIFATSYGLGIAERLRIRHIFPESHQGLLKFYDPARSIKEFLKDLYLNESNINFCIPLLEHRLHPDDIPRVKILKP